jgi:hypothetical protein
MNKFAAQLAGIVAGMLGFSAAALAIPIAVTNPSFETLPAGGLTSPCGTNCSFSGPGAAIPGWITTGGNGQFHPGPPTNTTFFNTVPDGTVVAYSNGGTISQTTGATVQLGVLYTLLVDVGFRKDFPDLGTVELLIGTTPIIATGPVAQLSGDWFTYTATYTGLASDVGKSIGIALLSAGIQGDWDNVRLNAVAPAAVPEPAPLALLGLAIGAFALSRRRKTA